MSFVRRSLRSTLPLLAIAVTALVPMATHATWSVVAVDPATQEVGIAGASCIGGVDIIAGVAPGYGAVASQSYSNTQARDYAVMRLAQGASPAEIIAEVTSTQFDFSPALRQYGIAALGFSPAGYTGAQNMAWAGNVDAENVSVQGNILYGPEVVDDALAAFQATAGECPYALAERLLVALEAGAAQGGDTRCTQQQTALSAFLIVARPSDDASDPFIRIIVPNQPKDGSSNPVTLLRQAYDAHKAQNPAVPGECEEDETTGTGGTDGETATDTGTDSGPGTGSDSGGGNTSSDTSGGSATTGSSSTTSTDSDGQATESGQTGEDESGCSCRADRTSGSAWALVLPTIALRRRKHRQR